MKGIWWWLRYHAGSIALGSLILTPLQFIQWIFKAFYNGMRMVDKDNSVG